MPDSYGKRQRRDVKAKKAVAREERRVARNQRREDRAAGLIEAGPPVGPSEAVFDDLPAPSEPPERRPAKTD